MSVMSLIMGMGPIGSQSPPNKLARQEFGIPISEKILLSGIIPLLSGECKPCQETEPAPNDPPPKPEKQVFQVNLDVHHFTPNEITVRTADGYIVIEAKHEEKEDRHGFIKRKFTRKYVLPEGCSAETVESKLSSDGVLTITAPKVLPVLKNERIVIIAPIDPVSKEDKDEVPQAN